MEKKDFINAISAILDELNEESLKAVFQMAVICRKNEENAKNHTIKSNKTIKNN